LDNYELLWVLESCLETPASAVYGLGPQPWSAGLLITHRQCIWLRVENEMLLSALLDLLPELDMYRFYTSNTETLEMLKRWFPQGQVSQSQLCVRNLTKTWRRRFDVTVQVNSDPSTVGGQAFSVTAQDGRLVATCASQQVVLPWQEIIQWKLLEGQDLVYWTEQVFGVITAAVLSEGCPVVVRIEDSTLFGILEPLGYREFSQLYYYVAARE